MVVKKRSVRKVSVVDAAAKDLLDICSIADLKAMADHHAVHYTGEETPLDLAKEVARKIHGARKQKGTMKKEDTIFEQVFNVKLDDTANDNLITELMNIIEKIKTNYDNFSKLLDKDSMILYLKFQNNNGDLAYQDKINNILTEIKTLSDCVSKEPLKFVFDWHRKLEQKEPMAKLAKCSAIQKGEDRVCGFDTEKEYIQTALIDELRKQGKVCERSTKVPAEKKTEYSDFLSQKASDKALAEQVVAEQTKNVPSVATEYAQLF